MKDKIIKSIQTHIGIYVFGGALTIPRIKTIGGKDQQHCEFTIYPGVGVYAKLASGAEDIIPFSNIIHIELEPEAKPGIRSVG